MANFGNVRNLPFAFFMSRVCKDAYLNQQLRGCAAAVPMRSPFPLEG